MTNLIKSILSIVVFSVFPFPTSAQIDQVALMNDLRILSHDSMEGRKTGTDGNEKAREFILKRLREIAVKPLESDFQQKFNFSASDGEKTGTNILGHIEGIASSNSYFVISAHYDHIGVRSGEIYNGADDNASGVAALLAIANYFKKNSPRHSMIFAFFDAEESGLQGAKAFVATNFMAIILNVNMDMISRNDKNEIYIAGTYQNPDLKELVQKSLSQNDRLKVLFGHDTPGSGGHDWSNSSDHGPFSKAGIPFLYFGVEDHEDYHKPGDDFEKIDINFYNSVVEMLVQVINSLDKELE